MNRLLHILGRCYLTLLLIFVLGPAVVVAVDSLNSATSFPSPFEGATLGWYAALADHPEFLSALWVSLLVALSAAGTATITGFLASYALMRVGPRTRNAVATVLTAPLLVPEIVVGLAILQIAGLTGTQLGISLLAGAHAVFVLPLALRVILAGFSQFEFRLEEAARSLGATPSRAMRLVTLPLLGPSLAAAFILSVVLSFVNLPLSMFLTTARTATLPVIVFSYMESRIDPMIAAVATLVMLFAIVVAIVADRILRIRQTA